jgi:hypothetical protein
MSVPFSNVVFAIRWLDSYGITLGDPVSAVYSITRQGPVYISGGYRYQKYAAATAQSITWTANTDVPVMTVSVPQTGNGTGTFSLAHDAWTSASNGEYYVEIAGRDCTGSIYQSDAGGVPLPIAVSSFSASVADEQVILHWRLDEATGLVAVIIERRLHQNVWTTAGQEEAGTDVTFGQHSYIDADHHAEHGGEIQYRLRLTYADGHEQYSPILIVRFDGNIVRASSLQAYPNPAPGLFELVLTLSYEDHITIGIYDALGRHARTFASNRYAAQGVTVFSLDASGLAPGPYFVTATGSKIRTTKHILITNQR